MLFAFSVNSSLPHSRPFSQGSRRSSKGADSRCSWPTLGSGGASTTSFRVRFSRSLSGAQKSGLSRHGMPSRLPPCCAEPLWQGQSPASSHPGGTVHLQFQPFPPNFPQAPARTGYTPFVAPSQSGFQPLWWGLFLLLVGWAEVGGAWVQARMPKGQRRQ